MPVKRVLASTALVQETFANMDLWVHFEASHNGCRAPKLRIGDRRRWGSLGKMEW